MRRGAEEEGQEGDGGEGGGRGASAGGGTLTEAVCERQRLQRVSSSHVGVSLWG